MYFTYNIEDSGERTANIVEGHTKILEREIVEDNHTYKYYRERKNLQCKGGREGR